MPESIDVSDERGHISVWKAMHGGGGSSVSSDTGLVWQINKSAPIIGLATKFGLKTSNALVADGRLNGKSDVIKCLCNHKNEILSLYLRGTV